MDFPASHSLMSDIQIQLKRPSLLLYQDTHVFLTVSSKKDPTGIAQINARAAVRILSAPIDHPMLLAMIARIIRASTRTNTQNVRTWRDLPIDLLL